MTNDLYRVQEELEQEARTLTINRFENELRDKIERGDESSTYYGNTVMKRSIESVIQGIHEVYEEADKGHAGRRSSAVAMMKLFKPEILAFFTAKVIMDRISKKAILQDMAINVAQFLEDELRLQSFEDQKPYLLKSIQNNKETTRTRKRTEIIAAYNRYCEEWVAWSKDEKTHLGTKLIYIFQERTGYIELVMRKKARSNKSLYNVIPTQKVVDFIEKNKHAASLMQPIFQPMVVPPMDWTSPFSGGYLTHYTPRLPLIKTANRNYLKELENLGDELKDVYDAVNTIQKTPWSINKFVLETFQKIHDNGIPVANLPPQEDMQRPPSPLLFDRDSTTLTDEEKIKFKAWKKKATKIYDENIRIGSKRNLTARVRFMAEKYSEFESIFFVHTMDFRGRLYPAGSSHLSPQGNDLSKGLLQFADGKPLGTNEAACELAIHGANCFGYDKASMQERVDWVIENEQRILQVAHDPMEDLWWAKEADSPWCFLAFCKEWEGYNLFGYDHVNYIPVCKDGSCSGLQHFSAALNDNEGASQVNLLPLDKPADIYQTVIDKAIVKVKADAKGGENKEIAQAWLDFGMNRSSSKRSVMTRVYGSTLFSARSFVQEYIEDTDLKRLQADRSYVSPLLDKEFDAAIYLAKYIWEAINDTVKAAKTGMDWLQSCARELAKENLPITWTTIDGLPIMQNYPDMKKRRVKTKFGDKLIYMTVQEAIKDKLDSRRQGNGISPNWVHANDSCHLRMTVNLSKFNGVTHFAMIHDSFGCHAADVEMLGACLRETFIELYVENDPLQKFKDEGELLIDRELPDLPPKGDFDVTQVRESEFFFA